MNPTLTRNESLSVANISKADAESVYCKISVDIHQKNTLPSAAATALYSEMLLSGCGKLSREAFLDALNQLGAAVDVAIEIGVLTITIKTRRKRLKPVLQLLESILTEPKFSPHELRRVKVFTESKLDDYKENARGLAHDGLCNACYQTHDRRYEYSPQSLTSAIKKISTKDIKGLHELVLSSHWYLTSSGSENSNTTIAKKIATVKATTSTKTYKQYHQVKTTTGSQFVFQDIPSKQNIEFSLGQTLPLTLHHPQYAPFVFGLNVLGKWGGFTGRLMSTVREKEGLTYGIYARTEYTSGDEQGMWRIMTFFSPQQAETGLRSTLREINKIRERGITTSELERFTTILATQETLKADSLIRMTNDLHAYNVHNFTLEEMQEFKRKLISVDRASVNRALEQYLSPSDLIISAAGPVQNVKKQLQTVLP